MCQFSIKVGSRNVIVYRTISNQHACDIGNNIYLRLEINTKGIPEVNNLLSNNENKHKHRHRACTDGISHDPITTYVPCIIHEPARCSWNFNQFVIT